uniref:Ribosomal eL28/Mak16 domain-containing protein n=1 Tax=Piliocolobus tephrosceles TaxID=591936 RepID=A0A8C9GWT5_9PRIM
MFCKNEYNVTGLCTRVNCPLSNSVYATVILDKGEIYLYLKYPENAHLPSIMWSRTLLSLNKQTAFNYIYKTMKYTHNKTQIKKCMKRYMRLKEILKRTRKMVLNKQLKLLPVKKKTERRDSIREKKALKAAKIVNNVELELLNRLNTGVYGNLYKMFDKKKKKKKSVSEISQKDMTLEETEDNVEEESESKKKKKKKKDLEMEAIESIEDEEDVDGYEYDEVEDDDEDVDVDVDDDDDDDDDDDEDVDDDADVDDDVAGDSDNDATDDEEDNADANVDMEDLDDDDSDLEDLDEEFDIDYDDEDIDDGEEKKKQKKTKKKKRKEQIEEYVDNEYIKKLKEAGKLLDEDEEIEDMNDKF